VGGAASPSFPPEVALYIVKLACELPAEHGVALSLWDCKELARQLEADGLVDHISAETVRRVLAANALKPWRYHSWLSAKVPRDAAFAAAVSAISDLYTRPLAAHEVVLCMDEKTSIQLRQRLAPTRPAAAGRPVQVEQEYKRAGALNLFAAFDTRSGDVVGWSAERKRAQECVAFLDLLDARLAPEITVVHVVLDNLRVHKSKLVNAWLGQHPRFVVHFPPIHCSWMNQVEQWFSILCARPSASSISPDCSPSTATCIGSLSTGTVSLTPSIGRANPSRRSWRNAPRLRRCPMPPNSHPQFPWRGTKASRRTVGCRSGRGSA
jgi:hypothetical protein